MYSISPRLANNYSTGDELNSLVDAVDARIAELAIVAMNNVRFGFDKTVDYEQYEDLLIYKKMLYRKLLGCNCLEDQLLLKIISRLKKLIK